MQFRAIFAGVPALLVLGSAAFAAPATPEGARHLTSVLQAYLSDAPGMVQVLPVGEAYTVTVDFTPLLKRIPGDVVASLTPLEFVVADQGDGIWAASQDQNLTLLFAAPGQLDLLGRISGLRADGLFDESLGAFFSMTVTFSNLSIQQMFRSPEVQGDVRIASEIEQGHFTLTSSASAAGGLDRVSKYTMGGVSEVVRLDPMHSGDLSDLITLTATGFEQNTTWTGLRSGAVEELLKWVVAHPSPDAAIDGQAVLRRVLSAAMPVFENITSTVLLTGVKLATPVGAFGADALGFGVNVNGVIADGGVGESISVSGLSLPAGLLPPWSAGLAPTDADLSFRVSGFDLAAPATLLIGAFDLEKPNLIDPAMGEFLLSALLPKGTVEVTLLPGRVASGLYELQFQGSMTAGEMVPPTGSAWIALRGMEQVLAALSAAPAEVKDEAVLALLLIKGLANAEADDNFVWRIDSPVSGQVLINGFDVTELFGGR